MIFYTNIKAGKIVMSRDITDYISTLRDCEVEVRITKKRKKRTELQNRALHLYFDKLSEELNDKGISSHQIFSESVEMFWTPTLVKEIWRKVQQAMFKKKSTKELLKHEEIDRIYDVMNKLIIERSGGQVSVPFPCLEELDRSLGNNWNVEN